jgi:signal transduction histidine kinase
MQKARSRISTHEIQISTPDGRKLWLEMSVIPVSGGGLAQDLLILCANITYRKEAQLEIERLNQERFDEQMRQQVLRSAQIVEAQEEERKRIARDIHDGIGQMLTALKFNLDSLDPMQPDKIQAKLEKLQGLTTKLIQGRTDGHFQPHPARAKRLRHSHRSGAYGRRTEQAHQQQYSF